MKITKNCMVQIHYTLTGEDGKVLDSSREGSPLEYLHGHENLIAGLEAALEGKDVGDAFEVDVAAKDGYGEFDERLVTQVPRHQFDAEVPIEIGMRFQADTIAGPTIVRVTKITDDEITVDANHELAGKALHFSVDVVAVREATEEELIPESFGCSSCGCGGGCSSCGDSDNFSCGCGSGGCGCH